MAYTEAHATAEAVHAAPRLQARHETPAMFPEQGDMLPADADTGPDYPLAAFMEATHQQVVPTDEADPEEHKYALDAGPYPGAAEAAPEEVPEELAHEQAVTRIAALAALTPEEIKAMTEEERALLREHLMAALERVATVEARVQVYARVMDVYGLDTIIGFICPEYGDIATGVVGAAYLLWEAENADLETIEKWKIVGFQVADVALGLIPGLDLILDTGFQANVLGAKAFTKQVEKLATNARAAGVPEEVVQQILNDAKVIQERLDLLHRIYKWFTEDKDKEKDPDGPRPNKVPDPAFPEPVYA
jgi:hypothetical protein